MGSRILACCRIGGSTLLGSVGDWRLGCGLNLANELFDWGLVEIDKLGGAFLNDEVGIGDCSLGF